MADTDPDCDYVIVGSGAGGGTLAARLAEAGNSVVVLEAGGDPRTGGPRLPDDYDVPAFHPFASENPALSWDFFVNHYEDEARRRRDPNLTPAGIFYPRAGTLGGCTAHNAMILIAPHASDWDGIADATGDRSWSAANMGRYFQLLEECRHRPRWRAAASIGLEPTGHGWRGWLPTERAIPRAAFTDEALMRTVARSALVAAGNRQSPLESALQLFRIQMDPNDRRAAGCTGVFYTPLSTRGHRRVGTRERLLDVKNRHPDRLRIELHALATRVILDPANRATGVEYLQGERLYRASPNPATTPGEPRRILARREVILCGGAFNTPQLLMLSGIGAPDHLRSHGITPRVTLPGVGRNLQDRYEVAVVNRMTRAWEVLDGARFEAGDPLHQDWAERARGMYTSNGAALAVALRSQPARADPDIFCMALLARFAGYKPGYSRDIAAHRNYLTWAVLKAHTNNRAGSVTLQSADPRTPPRVDFRYFEEGSDTDGEDLAAVVAAIRQVRRMTAPLKAKGLIAEEELPGPVLQDDAALGQYVRDTAWGHHASCTCQIGDAAAGGVLDSNFRVHGTRDLRVVDASVFPRIPGFFIVSAVYMAAEKAADVIMGGGG